MLLLLIEKDVENVDYTKYWVHIVVIIEKINKRLRICLDPLYLNACLKRNKIPHSDSRRII